MPQARASFVTIDDGPDGPLAMPGVIPKLTGTPGRIEATGPGIGQHNDEIYGGLLGLPASERRRLAAAGVI